MSTWWSPFWAQGIVPKPGEEAKLAADRMKYGVCYLSEDGYRVDPETVLLPDDDAEGQPK